MFEGTDSEDERYVRHRENLALKTALESAIAERDALKDQLFEARQALFKEGMRANALQARIDSGIRVRAHSIPYLTGKGQTAIGAESNHPEDMFNSTLILDEPS